LLETLGPRTLQSLALVAEVVHGTPTRFQDPALFSFAHGGKDGHDFGRTLAHERAISPQLDGRTVFDTPNRPRQPRLF
jgi:hypothetical protein